LRKGEVSHKRNETTTTKALSWKPQPNKNHIRSSAMQKSWSSWVIWREGRWPPMHIYKIKSYLDKTVYDYLTSVFHFEPSSNQIWNARLAWLDAE
jgi:hypothetical protein